MIDTSFLKQLDKFNLVIKKRITSSFTGDRKTQTLGSGLIFSGYDNYVPGNDFKLIDWKAYARSDKLFVKRYEEDRNLTVHAIIDFSGSMNFGTKRKKYEYASMIGLGFAYIALKNNERFVLSAFDKHLDFFKPSKGVRQIASILNYLEHKKPEGETKLLDSLIQYKALIHSKALVIIISDFLCDIEDIKIILHKFKRNKIKLIQVLDVVETKMNVSGEFQLEDLETHSTMDTFIDPFMKKQYFDKLEKHNAQIRRSCSEVGADFYSVSTGEDIFDVFYSILG